jgi:hypothetical protein
LLYVGLVLIRKSEATTIWRTLLLVHVLLQLLVVKLNGLRNIA